MKFLLKITILILAARVLAGTPRGSNKEVDAVGDFSVREIAVGISSAVEKAEVAVRGLWTEPSAAPPKVVARHNASAPRPGD